MTSRLIFALLFASSIKLSLQYDIEGGWCYKPNNYRASKSKPCGTADSDPCGPENWKYISETCGAEGTQSPINFGLAPIVTDNTFGPIDIPKDTLGCTVLQQLETRSAFQVTFIGEDKLSCGNLYVNWNGKKYYLKQFHLHSPSEHSYGSGYYDGEVHLVHQTDAGDFLVMAIFLEASASVMENQFLAPFWARGFTTGEGKFEKFDKPVNPYIDFLPPVKSYLTYNGSLTVPPCTTPVNWIMFTQPLFTTAAELDKMRTTLQASEDSILSEDLGSNRPVQPLGGRSVYYVDPRIDASASQTSSRSSSSSSQSSPTSASLVQISLIVAAVALAVAIGGVVFGIVVTTRMHRAASASSDAGNDIEEAKSPLMSTELPPIKAAQRRS